MALFDGQIQAMCVLRTIFALQYAVFEEVHDRGALFLVQPTHRGLGHGLCEPHFDVVREIGMLFRNLEKNGEVAGPEAVPEVKQMREKRE